MCILKFSEEKSIKLAHLESDKQVINETGDILDLIGNADYNGCSHLLVHDYQLHPDFFELKSGLAGEMLQKISTYRKFLAIIGDFTQIESKSLRDFISESNKYGRIIFVKDEQEALQYFGNSKN